MDRSKGGGLHSRYLSRIHLSTVERASVLSVSLGYPEEDPSETDTRYSFCAVATLQLLNRLDAIDQDKAVDYIIRCQNFDGAFGVREGSESHAGQVFCCVGMLKILDKIEKIDSELLGWWLAERQVNTFASVCTRRNIDSFS